MLELAAQHLVERIAWTVGSQAYLQHHLLDDLADRCARIELKFKGEVRFLVPENLETKEQKTLTSTAWNWESKK